MVDKAWKELQYFRFFTGWAVFTLLATLYELHAFQEFLPPWKGGWAVAPMPVPAPFWIVLLLLLRGALTRETPTSTKIMMVGACLVTVPRVVLFLLLLWGAYDI